MSLKTLGWIVAFAVGLTGVLLAPDLFVDPGPLIKGHAKLQGKCYDCHQPVLGPTDDKCIACHKPAEIGLKTPTKVPFHQHLTESRCTGCHTDHLGPEAKQATREFDHSLLTAQARPGCRQCHTKPNDKLHRSVKAECSACHSSDRWKPATLDHDKHFRFDRDHPPDDCEVCHTGGNYERYTCYGCHEHSERNVRGEHLEEGIRDFQDCVKCHRSADEDEAERVWKALRRGGKIPAGGNRRGGDDDDDD